MSVFPNHRTLAASAETAITFRGVGAGDLDDVEITGSRSGRHQGSGVRPDGGGAAFVPARPFTPGERVTVDVGMRVAGARGEHSTFVVARRSTARPPRYDQAKPPQDRGVHEIVDARRAAFDVGAIYAAESGIRHRVEEESHGG